MKSKTLFMSVLVIGLVMLTLFISGGKALTQDQPPAPFPDAPPVEPGGFGNQMTPDGLVQNEDGFWIRPAGSQPATGDVSQIQSATGGPDDFGYTWDNTVSWNWISASGGSDVGINGYSSGLINIGFPFKFYENSYTGFYVSRNGYISFDNAGLDSGQSRIPAPGWPNNLIAPHMIYIDNINGYIRYLNGGTSPNRWLAIEWNQVQGYYNATDTFTFEVILHENGEIVFQYNNMDYNGGYFCPSSGIEDFMGLDGLAPTNFCEAILSFSAVRFYRPAPAARVGIFPAYQGEFSSAGITNTFQIPIRNTGELGADTFDIFPSSSWPTNFYAADGITPLTDNDGDSVIDTGTIAEGETVTVVAKVQTPPGANLGDENQADILVQSSLDTAKSRTAVLQTSIPAPFAQTFRDGGGANMLLAQPAGQKLTKPASDSYQGYTFESAIAEVSNGQFVHVLNHLEWDNVTGIYTYPLKYSIMDRYGNLIRGLSRLTNANATVNTYDQSPAIAATPDGKTGITWYRYLYNSNIGQFNYNIYFAVLDADGNVAYGPVNLTNNNVWGTWGDYYVPRFYNPQISATGNNRFIIAWSREHQAGNGYVTDIYYTVRNSSGSQVKGITKLTNDTAGWEDGYSAPSLASLPNNQALISFQRSGNYGDVYISVVNSNGDIVKGITNLSNDSNTNWDWNPDAVQLSDGKIAVAWTGGVYPDYQIRYAILNSAFSPVYGPSFLNNPASLTGDSYVSVTADKNSNAIFTWMDNLYGNKRTLYYSLVNSDGNVVTQPMIFQSSQYSSPSIETSYTTNGNTSYSWTPASGVDAKVDFSTSLYGIPPGGYANLPLNYGNYGATMATGVVLTATLDSDLTYVSDTSGIVPTVNGNDVVWNLPDLSFFGSGSFSLEVQAPIGAAYGDRYPITVSLTSNEVDANSSDNNAGTEAMASYQIFLPAINKQN